MPRGNLYNELPFPRQGVNVASGFTHQPKGTVYDARNARSYDPTTNANRGSQRCGHSKYLPGILNIAGGTPANVTKQIAVTGDDGYFDSLVGGSGAFDNAGTFVEFGSNSPTYDYEGFFRFTGITIPAGATITSATLTLTTTAPAQGDTFLTVGGELAANPAAVTSAADGQSRIGTFNNVNWEIPTWSTPLTINSPNLASVIQEIINQGGWVSGNALQLLILQLSGFTSLRVVGDDGSHPATRASLSINYSTGGTPASIQNINHLMVSGAFSGASYRTLTGVGVAGGTVKTFARGAVYTATTNGAAALSTTNPYIGSTVLLNKLYFADGVVFKYYDPSDNTVHTMTASAGSLPVDGSGNAPRLVVTWRGRLVYSGLIGDPTNWFMSRQFVPLDWNYSPAFPDATMAVAGNNTEAGLIPDIVTTMIPYSDDLLIFGSDHAMWQMTEDPAAGGAIDRISDVVGIAFGDSWCKDAFGNVWFIGSRGGLYVFRPTPGESAAPVRVSSQSIDEKLMTINFSQTIVRMAWDDRFQTVMLYLTPIAGGATINWAYDTRNEAFWPDSFTNTAQQPTAVHLIDGDNPSDRVVLLGGSDGSIRFIDLAAKSDDGTAISSYLKLGPIQNNGEKLRVAELITVMGESSDPATIQLFTGHSAETAFNAATPRYTNTVGAGRSYAMRPGTTGQALFLKISNSVFNKAWQFEIAYALMQKLGRAAARQL